MNSKRKKSNGRNMLSRRDFLRVGGAGVAGIGGLATLGGLVSPDNLVAAEPQRQDGHEGGHGAAGTVGQIQKGKGKR